MPEQGLSGLTGAKVLQKIELTKYFGKKNAFLVSKDRKWIKKHIETQK